MKLIYIRSTMEPKNYSTIRSILKKEQGEKIAPYIFKINDTQTIHAAQIDLAILKVKIIPISMVKSRN